MKTNYRKIKMKLILIYVSLLIIAGCNNLLTKSDEAYDDQLITDIINAEQIAINMEDLPALSRSTITQY